jgi:hypothetical protein
MLSFSAIPSTGLTGGAPNQSYQFPSATAPGTQITISDFTGGNPTVGTISVAFGGISPPICAQEIDTSMFPVNAPISSGQVQFTLQTFAHNGATPVPIGSPSPFPTGGIACTLIATDSHLSTAILNVTVNNITGAVPVQ